MGRQMLEGEWYILNQLAVIGTSYDTVREYDIVCCLDEYILGQKFVGQDWLKFDSVTKIFPTNIFSNQYFVEYDKSQEKFVKKFGQN